MLKFRNKEICKCNRPIEDHEDKTTRKDQIWNEKDNTRRVMNPPNGPIFDGSWV